MRAAFGSGLAKLPTTEVEPDWSYDVAGFLCDVGRYSAGMPDCMWMTTEHAATGERPIMTLAVNVCVSASIDAQNMANYGMAVAHYVDELEADGLRVEVIAAFPLHINGVDVCISWTVKAANQQMNLETVAFSIAHPAGFRRLGFAVCERLPKFIKEHSGYGNCRELEARHLPGAPEALLLNGMNRANSHSRSGPAAYAHIQIEIEAARVAAENRKP
jgi:hypothetical protein